VSRDGKQHVWTTRRGGFKRSAAAEKRVAKSHAREKAARKSRRANR